MNETFSLVSDGAILHFHDIHSEMRLFHALWKLTLALDGGITDLEITTCLFNRTN